MRKAGLALAFIVVVFLAAPPTLYADEGGCYVNTFDGNGNWCQTTSTRQKCGPWNNNW